VLAEMERGGEDPAARLLDALGARATAPDTLARRAGLSESDAVSQLVLLELSGAIERRPGGRYARRRPGA
jgi:predicted Rossmann fold nucleotide-binding protein DprA/Smf involved in DNA uptake